MNQIKASFLGCLALCLFMCSSTFAQNNAWSDLEEDRILSIGERQIIPNQYRVLHLDIEALQESLADAPKRFSKAADTETLLIEMPLPDSDEWATFKVLEVKTMEAELQAKYPDMRTYLGVNVENAAQRIRFDVTMHGFHGMVLYSDKGSFFIDPYQTNDLHSYICYYKKHYSRATDFQCHVGSDRKLNQSPEVNLDDYKSMAGDCSFRTYRLANAATGEYTAFHGGTVAAGQAAIVVAMNRVNEVYEIDFGIQMILIGNNDQLVYTDGTSDPYSNGSGGAMLGENQTNIDNIIGSANYDIGHVFSTGGGGVAYLGSVCGGSKAGGVTGQGSPINDPFSIDYVAHEMGHQFGGNHTQNNSCNRNSNTSYEPGSASTIMGYAGICNPNVQNNSDAYFTAISVQEMETFSTFNNGNSCANVIPTSNNQPVVDGGSDYTIPISTPFELTAVGTDSNDDALTYCWEQHDREVATMPPAGTNTGGPMFRSLFPTTSPTRHFPSLDNIINNTNDTWEVLPTVSRTMNFRVTVRDNNVNGGCTDEDDIELTVSDNAGPFLVNSPNTNVTWNVGDSETVTWDVANTNQAPVSCANVDILLSTDGGLTYPVTLASNVPNDGSHSVAVPNNPSTDCRVKVICSDNVFYDISNQNFSIIFSQPTFILSSLGSVYDLCGGGVLDFDIEVNALGGFNSAVNVTASGGPAGTTFSLGTSTFNPGGTTVLTATVPNGSTVGTYTIQVDAVGGGINRTETIDIAITGAPTQASLSTPANGATGEALQPVLNWNADPLVSGYTVEIATDASFTNIIESASVGTNSYSVIGGLNPLTLYYWRVYALNSCGSAAASGAYSFETTLPNYCGSAGNISNEEWIAEVVLNTINNATGDDGGYADYTNLSTDLQEGNAYPTTLTPGFGGQTYPEYWRIWIDFNKNGDFTDAGELVFDAGSTNDATITGNVVIPVGAALGVTRMRVGMKYNGAPDPCETYDYGEVEDYSVNILGNCADADTDGVCDVDDVCAGGDDNVDTNANGTPDDCEPVTINLNVMLEGAFLSGGGSGQMGNGLYLSGQIPNNHPYNTAPYNYSGSENLTTIPANMVDWILVEVRTGPNPADKIDTQIGLLLMDGSITATDAVSGLTFNLPAGGDYYIVVRHRNHLDVMTANAVPRALLINYDFTTAVTQAFGAEQLKTMSNGMAAMFAGDVDQNQVIQNTDYNAWQLEPAILDTYIETDMNLDGTVQTTDYDVWFENKAKLSPSELGY